MKDPDLMSERELRFTVKAFYNTLKQVLKEAEVELIDPIWKDHYNDIDAAYEAYKEDIEGESNNR